MHPVGRFAPTPSGRMHLGNVFAGLIAWLSVKAKDGEMVLRMEDLDTQRTSAEFARILREDLSWLGLTWDQETPPQSSRSQVYDRYFDILQANDLLYPCYCTRSQLHSVNAPHLSDGTYVYPGTCRNLTDAQRFSFDRQPAWRVKVPQRLWQVEDLCQGSYRENLATDCGDFVVRRADGVAAYQLAVVVDDAKHLVTVTERGYGKRSPFDDFRTMANRGGFGVRCQNVTEKTGLVAGIAAVDGDSDLMMITDQGTIIRTPASDLSILSRTAGGVIVMRLPEGQYVANFTVVAKEEEDEADTEAVELELEAEGTEDEVILAETPDDFADELSDEPSEEPSDEV